jgi:DNA-directed RNA polymerase delta subunit
MGKDEIRDVILHTMIVSTEAQLKALKKLRSGGEEEEPRIKSKSQTDIAYDILTKAGKPLHISQIIADAEKMFGAKLERESLVSALSKKVMKEDRFVRTGKNTFALKAR